MAEGGGEGGGGKGGGGSKGGGGGCGGDGQVLVAAFIADVHNPIAQPDVSAQRKPLGSIGHGHVEGKRASSDGTLPLRALPLSPLWTDIDLLVWVWPLASRVHVACPKPLSAFY